MSQPQTLLVVGLIAANDADAMDIPDDIEEISAYELTIRIRVGRPVPDPVMIVVSSQDEVVELVDGIKGADLTLDIMTDDLNRPKLANLEELMALLSQNAPKDDGTKGSDGEDLFRIL